MFIGPSLALTGAGRLLYPILVGADSFAPPLTLTRAQLAGVQSSATGADGATLGLFGADVARFAGAARRLLIEGQRTNAIRNPRAEGAVAGTPGTLPTNWGGTAPTGLTRTLTAETRNGIAGLRVRFAGTASSTAAISLNFDAINAIAAANGQVWAASLFFQGISAVGLSGDWLLEVWAYDSGSGFLSTGSAPPEGTYATSSTAFVRLTTARTLADATTAFARQNLRTGTSINNGTVVDVEFWLGFPQLEQGAFASSAILPPVGTPGASTRGADLVSASLSSLGIPASGACTVLWSGMIPQAAPSGINQIIARLDDGTASNAFVLRNGAGGSLMEVIRVLGGSANGAAIGTMTAGTPFRAGCVIDGAGRIAGSFNGAAAVALTGGPTSGLTTFAVGQGLGGSQLFGETLALRVLPYTLSDTDLAAAVAALPT